MARRRSNSTYGQLRWVILLLAVAVILPTVCLLWFMNQAVKNVQLAARQKLITLYQDKLDTASQAINQSWSQQLDRLDLLVNQNLSPEVLDNSSLEHYSLIIYDGYGKRIYPLLASDIPIPIDPAKEFRDAWRLEFAEQRFDEAIRSYEKGLQSSSTYVRLSALIGKARSLIKLGNSSQAAKVYKKVAFCPEESINDTATQMLVANTRLLLAELTKPAEEDDEHPARQDFRDLISRLSRMVAEQNQAGAVLPLDRRVFLARKVLDLGEDVSTSVQEDRDIQEALNPQSLMKILHDGEFMLAAIEHFPKAQVFSQWPADQFRQLQLNEQTICYGIRHKTDGKTILLLEADQEFELLYERDFKGTGVACRVLDDLGRVVTGSHTFTDRPFLTARIGNHFADWQVELYFNGDDILAGAAQRQMTLYIWAGTLVVVLILATGGFAAQRLSRQMRLNRLRNDFIATVSHELKTPLASTRVLADTLLQGNYRDEKQATEYLQLICQENERLSGLIDNFLTFSRMERNKQAFKMTRTSPTDIAHAASEAVTTKLNGGRCEFQIQIAESLPDILADRDAMVTVLVNLLDNAYKYSDGNRRIELTVYAETGSVCFAVKDNGMGMSGRTAKSIFNKFYQADPSLTRQTEGCGLGLSIVKFIVDAHRGSITVDSQPGKGSTFVVKLPALN